MRKGAKILKPLDYFKQTRTDKQMYGGFYNMAIQSLYALNGPIRVLEIGCIYFLNMYGSGSSNAFSKMPFVEKYVGIDIVPPKNYLGEKAEFIQGDAYSQETIDKVFFLSEDYHLIIDDGNHGLHMQIDFFRLYEKFCAPKSMMVCEDVNAENIHVIVKALLPYNKQYHQDIHLVSAQNKLGEILETPFNLLVKFKI